MDKPFYSTTIFFLAVSIAAGLFHGFMQLSLGKHLAELPSIAVWVVAQLLITTGIACMLLWYYWRKEFRIAFYGGLAAAVTSLIYLLVNLQMIWTKQLSPLLIPALILTLVAGVVYGSTLVFSRASERNWLKLAGILTIALSMVTGMAFLYGTKLPDLVSQMRVQQGLVMVGMFGNLIPLVLILNFRKEIKSVEEYESLHESPANGVARVVTFLGTLAVIISGMVLAMEGVAKLKWDKELAKRVTAWEKDFEKRTVGTENEGQLTFQLAKPSDFDPDKTYPMVVCLPYGEGIFGAPIAQWLLSDTNRKAYPSFLFVPYAKVGHGWGGVPFYTNVDTPVFEAIEALLSEFPQIDRNRIYVSGISLGGYGTWHFMYSRPDLFAAGIPVSGGGNPALASRIAHSGVWAFHGAKDKNVPVGQSRDLIHEIEKAGGTPRYTEFPNREHGIWDDVMQTDGVLDWLFAQRLHKESASEITLQETHAIE